MAPLQPPSIERLPDDLLLHILNYVSDIKSLGRCSAVSRRFRLLVPLLSSLLIHVDSIVFSSRDSILNFSPALIGTPFSRAVGKPTILYSLVFCFTSASIISPLIRRLKPLGFNSCLPIPNPPFLYAPSTPHTLVNQVLKNFSHLRTLRIYLPSGELSIHDNALSSSALLRWRAHYGSSLSRCLILSAVSSSSSSSSPRTGRESAGAVAYNDTIPDSFYTKLGVDWAMSSLFAAFARHCLLTPIIAVQTTLEKLVLTDADGQGMLRMDRDQMEELRKNPFSASSERKVIPAIRMRQWYAPVVELSCGVVLKGATLVAVRPSSGGEKEEEEDVGLGWIEEEFDGEEGDGMDAEAVRMLVKEGRTHYMEMMD